VVEKSIRPLTADESCLIGQIREQINTELRLRYSETEDLDGVKLLQHTVHDGSFAGAKIMEPLGIVWGDLIGTESGAEWVTAEWQGRRMLALNVPGTTILLFPIAMLEKRRDRNESVDFRRFLANTADAIEKMKGNPEYQR
jgi:hypothetical protein